MRVLSAIVFAAGLVLTAGAGAPAQEKKGEKKEEKKERPKLDAKEWKKQASGLEIWDAKEGKGTEVKAGETVTIHYTGWLTDANATEFDSSHKTGMAATFPLNNLIKGWQEGIPGMKPGGVRRLKIPAELAYGNRAVGGGLIPANSVLVFEIELVSSK